MSDQLQQAITLIKSGDQQKGRQILANILKANPRNEVAWLWMSSVVGADDQRLHCLKQVLIINPHNELAQRGLEKLKTKTLTESKSTTFPRGQNISSTPTQQSDSYEIQPHNVNAESNSEQKPKLKRLKPVREETNVNEGLRVEPEKSSPAKTEQSIPATSAFQVENKSNLGLGCFGAVLGIVLSAILWGVIVDQVSWSVHTTISLGLMTIGFGGLIGATVRVLGRGNRPTFGVIAAIVSFVAYFLGSYLAYSADYRGSWVPLLSNVLEEENFKWFIFSTLWFTVPRDIIFSLIAVSLSFWIAFRRLPRRREKIQTEGKEPESLPPTQTRKSSNVWIAVLGLTFVGCVAIVGAVSRPADIDQIILGLIIILLGLFPLAGAYFNWDWFMNNRRARLFVSVLGRNGARGFYALLGIVLMLIGLLIVVGFVDPYATG